jgi:hypothetical protein
MKETPPSRNKETRSDDTGRSSAWDDDDRGDRLSPSTIEQRGAT